MLSSNGGGSGAGAEYDEDASEGCAGGAGPEHPGRPDFLMAHVLLYVLTAFVIGRIHELFKFPGPLRIVLLVGGACVISALLTSPAKRQAVLRQREVRIVLGLAGLAVVMLPFGVWPGGSLTFLADTYSKVVLFFILIVTLATTPRIVRNLVWAVLVGVGLLGIFTLVDSPTTDAPDYASGRAYASSTYDPNDDAMMMVCTLPLAALGAGALRGAGRLGAAGVAVICVLATIKTVSRGGFIGLALVTLLLLFRLRSARARLIAGAAIVAVIAVAAPAAYWNIMGTIWKPADTGYTGYVERGILTRVEVWHRALEIFLRNPLTGVGIGMYENAAGLMYGPRSRGGWVTAHNSFLLLASELGLIGFALFVALLGVSVANARRALRAARADPRLKELEWIAAAVEISLYAYMVVGFALSQAYAPMLYFLVGVAAAVRIEVERRQQNAVPVDVAWWRPSAQLTTTL